MKKQAVILGGIVVVAISSMGGAALSILQDDQWSNYTQSWKTPMEIRKKKKNVIAEKLRLSRTDSSGAQITKR